jgi:hypothetical protein
MNKTDELIRTTKNLFSLNLIVVIYIVFTILSITDTQIVLNGVVKLPIFNVEISLIYFFFLSPITLLILYIYFLVNFKKTLESCTKLPPVTNSWLILETFYSSEYEKTERSNVFYVLEILIGYFAIWWILPLASLTILYKAIYTHEDILIMIIGSIIFLINILLLFSYYVIILKPKNKFWEFLSKLWLVLVIGIIYLFLYQPYLKTIFVRENIDLIMIYILIVGIGFLGGIIYWLFKKEKHHSKMFQTVWIFILLTPLLLSIHYTFFADLGEKKNINLNGQVLNDNVRSKIDLRNKNLDGINLIGATLINSILRNTDLRKAALSDATLDGSDFENTVLDSAVLQGTSLLNVKNLSYEQLRNVKTLYNASFDSTMDSIISKLIKSNPQLFKKPKY